MNALKILLLLTSSLMLFSCSKSSDCSEDDAMNKMLALNKVQGRIIALGGQAGVDVSRSIMMESASMGELIGTQKYQEACVKADEIAKKYGLNLEKEQEDMVTVQQLKEDGGKAIGGKCSVADAASKQMELHGWLRSEVDAGRKQQDIFQQFQEDTKSYAHLLSTDPSAACKLFDDLRKKYEAI